MIDADVTERASVAPLAEPFDDVGQIAVLRGGGLGDLLFAVPAIEALAAAYPGARVTLLCSPMHPELLRNRLRCDPDFEVLPVSPGVRDGASRPGEVDAFFDRLAGRFDLSVQLHGGGRFSNPFLLRLDAAHSVGAATPDAARLERTLPYLYYQHEVLRALEVVGLAGAAPVMLEPSLRRTAEDAAAAGRVLPRTDAPTVVLHPGATDPRRRWPAESFAAVAGRLAADGCRVVLVGDGDDAQLADRIVAGAVAAGPSAAAGNLLSLAGRLSLGELVAVLAAATAFLGNDSGPRHLAQAVGTATVGIYWFGNLINAGPLARGRHRVQLGWTTTCPACGRDTTQVGWSAERCEHDYSSVAGVGVDDVYDDVCAIMATTPPPRGR